MPLQKSGTAERVIPMRKLLFIIFLFFTTNLDAVDMGDLETVVNHYTNQPDFVWDIDGYGTATGLVGALTPYYLKLDQTTPQTVSNGAPTFSAGITATSINLTDETQALQIDGSTILSLYNTGATIDNLYIRSGYSALTGTGEGNTLINTVTNSLTNGGDNILIGVGAGDSITTSSDNICIGNGAGTSLNASMIRNTLIGESSGSSIADDYNTCIGWSTCNDMTSAVSNVAIGYVAGDNETTGDGNIYIGSGASTAFASVPVSNSIALGQSATVSASNQMVIGGSSYGINDVYIGEGATEGTPIGFTLNATGGSGTNISGANLTIAGGKPTGSGTQGNIIFQTATPGDTGTTLQSLTTRMTLDNDDLTTDEIAVILNDDSLGGTFADTNGLRLQNSTAATVGTAQLSPALILEGQGYKTGAGAGTKKAEIALLNVPVEATSQTEYLSIQHSQADGTYAEQARLQKAGTALSTQFSGDGTFVASNYALSLQSNTTETWFEILNSGGTGRGAFFGMSTNDFELWSYQGGDLNFYTSATPSDGLKRLTINADGSVLVGSTSLNLAKLGIDGNADEIQFLVQGNATQTNPLATFENSAGTDQMTVSNTGTVTANDFACTDCLDFTEFLDSLTLDVATTIATGATSLTISSTSNTPLVITNPNTSTQNCLIINDSASDTTPTIVGNTGIFTPGNNIAFYTGARSITIADPDPDTGTDGGALTIATGNAGTGLGGVGGNLTVNLGDASGTDKTGGSFTFNAGDSTGTGSSTIIFNTAVAGTTGATVNTSAERGRIDSAGKWDLSTASGIETPSGANLTIDEAGEFAEDTTANQWVYGANPNVLDPVQVKCGVVENLLDTDDNISLGMFPQAVTVKSIACSYLGTGTTPATLTLEDGSGNAMTITGTNPTCVAHGTNASWATVTAANSLVSGEIVRFDTTNTPAPITDDYTVCISYIIDRQ